MFLTDLLRPPREKSRNPAEGYVEALQNIRPGNRPPSFVLPYIFPRRSEDDDPDRRKRRHAGMVAWRGGWRTLAPVQREPQTAAYLSRADGRCWQRPAVLQSMLTMLRRTFTRAHANREDEEDRAQVMNLRPV